MQNSKRNNNDNDNDNKNKNNKNSKNSKNSKNNKNKNKNNKKKGEHQHQHTALIQINKADMLMCCPGGHSGVLVMCLRLPSTIGRSFTRKTGEGGDASSQWAARARKGGRGRTRERGACGQGGAGRKPGKHSTIGRSFNKEGERMLRPAGWKGRFPAPPLHCCRSPRGGGTAGGGRGAQELSDVASSKSALCVKDSSKIPNFRARAHLSCPTGRPDCTGPHPKTAAVPQGKAQS